MSYFSDAWLADPNAPNLLQFICRQNDIDGTQIFNQVREIGRAFPTIIALNILKNIL